MAAQWPLTQRNDSREESSEELKRSQPRKELDIFDLTHSLMSFVGDLSKEHKPTKQTGRLFVSLGSRLLITCIFIACMFITLKVFENQGNLSRRQKHIFNAILTALSLALGLNFFDTFKDMARVLRWRLLADRPFTIREMDLILGADSVTKPLRLLWESPTKPVIFFGSLGWITLNVAAQVAVAIISLTYSMDSGMDANGTYTVPGMVDSAKLDCYYNRGNCLPEPESNMTIAHNYGMLTRGTIRCDYRTDADINEGNQTCNYYGRPNGSDFAYQFRELNPKDNSKSYPYFTNRVIKAIVGQCHEYDTDDPIETDTTDGQGDGWIYGIHNQTYNGTIPVPKFDAAFAATTYIYNGTLAPQNATAISCGPRCLQMFALRSVDPRPQTRRKTAIFSCPITLSEVYNATLPTHHVLDDVARTAIASIALSGRYTTPTPDVPNWQQYQLYAWGSDWEINNLTAQEVGSRMAEFTIGTVAGLAEYNPRQRIPGTLPILGYHLSIDWRYVIPLLAAVAAAHSLTFILTIWIARPIVVVDDSYLCTARLLQPLVQRLHGGGSLLNGKELARAIQDNPQPSPNLMREHIGKVVYGLKQEGASGQKTLRLAEDIQIKKRLPGKKFPRGLYN